MRNQKVVAQAVKGFDNRKTTVTRPTVDVGKPNKRMASGQDTTALKKLFAKRVRQGA